MEELEEEVCPQHKMEKKRERNKRRRVSTILTQALRGVNIFDKTHEVPPNLTRRLPMQLLPSGLLCCLLLPASLYPSHLYSSTLVSAALSSLTLIAIIRYSHPACISFSNSLFIHSAQPDESYPPMCWLDSNGISSTGGPTTAHGPFIH